MAWNTGTKAVTGTAAQVEGTLANLDRSVKAVLFKARASNGANIYVGDSGVASSDGYELVPNATLTPIFEEGSELWSNFFAVAGSGSPALLDWTVVFED